MAKQERAQLKDILNYDPEVYFSEEEVSLLRSHFKGNVKLLAVLRKLFIPTIADPSLPIEQMAEDVWMSSREWAQIPAEEAKILMVARQDALKFILGGFVRLKIFLSATEENPMAEALRRSKDTNK